MNSSLDILFGDGHLRWMKEKSRADFDPLMTRWEKAI